MANYRPGPGRLSKGARNAFMTRIPQDVATVVEVEATARDLSFREYLALIAARAHGFEVTIPPRQRPGATGLGADQEQTAIPLEGLSKSA